MKVRLKYSKYSTAADLGDRYRSNSVGGTVFAGFQGLELLYSYVYSGVSALEKQHVANNWYCW